MRIIALIFETDEYENFRRLKEIWDNFAVYFNTDFSGR